MIKSLEDDLGSPLLTIFSRTSGSPVSLGSARSILISKTFFTEKNERAAEIIDKLPDGSVRRKARFQR